MPIEAMDGWEVKLQSQHLHRDHHSVVSQRQTDSNHLGNIPDIPGEGGRGEGNH